PTLFPYTTLFRSQQLPKERNTMIYDVDKLNGLASSSTDGKYYVVLWNRSDLSQTIKLHLTHINANDFNYDMYLINSASFSYFNGNNKTPTLTKSGVANTIDDIVLEKEATVFLTFTRK